MTAIQSKEQIKNSKTRGVFKSFQTPGRFLNRGSIRNFQGWNLNHSPHPHKNDFYFSLSSTLSCPRFLYSCYCGTQLPTPAVHPFVMLQSSTSVSYTHLDVYKRQHIHAHRHFSSCFAGSTIRISPYLEHGFFSHHHNSISLWYIKVKKLQVVIQ